MHLVPPDPAPQLRRYEPNWSRFSAGDVLPFPVDGYDFDVLRRAIDAVRVGHAVYPLRHPALTTFCPGPPGQAGEFFVEGFPQIVGHGHTPDEARRDWKYNFHAYFQELLAKRPFEMTEAESRAWKELDFRIDVAAYRARTPLSFRQIGVVTRARPYPDRVKWEDGRREPIRLGQAPDAFAAFRYGQRFEAIVLRDPNTFRLLRITHIERLRPLARVPEAESDALWVSIPTSASLPEAEWD